MKYWNQEKNPIVRAYLFGYHYGHLFLAPHLNPYPVESKEWGEWEKGWKKGAAFSVEQSNIDREMRNKRPSRRRPRPIPFERTETHRDIKELHEDLDSK